jgi:hypothetical protein
MITITFTIEDYGSKVIGEWTDATVVPRVEDSVRVGAPHDYTVWRVVHVVWKSATSVEVRVA